MRDSRPLAAAALALTVDVGETGGAREGSGA